MRNIILLEDPCAMALPPRVLRRAELPFYSEIGLEVSQSQKEVVDLTFLRVLTLAEV